LIAEQCIGERDSMVADDRTYLPNPSDGVAPPFKAPAGASRDSPRRATFGLFFREFSSLSAETQHS